MNGEGWLVARLCTGRPMSIARLTAGVGVTRQAVTKHLHVLAGAGLVCRRCGFDTHREGPGASCPDRNSHGWTRGRKLASMDRVERPVEPMTVLIVDDEPSITEMLQDILEANAYRVLSASKPPQAFAVVRDDPGPIDLLLVDVIMPELPGRDFAASVQARWPKCQVIFMSGYALEHLPAPGVPPGSRLISKPIVMPVLIDAVRTALGPPATDPT
jgi:CheY-like chemotaxis protein